MSGALEIRADQQMFDDFQRAALVQLGVGNASNGDLAVFMHFCQRTGLDPFARQCYMIERRSKNNRTDEWESKWTTQTSIDGFRVIARRAADKAGETIKYDHTLYCGPDGKWVDVWLSDAPPAAAKVVVYRNGEPFPATARYSAYVQTYKDKQTKEDKPTTMWQRMSDVLLGKCAEALSLRKAFPQDLSGVYSDDEMMQADSERTIDGQVVHSTPPQMSPAEAPPIPRELVREKMLEAAGGDQDLVQKVWDEAQPPDEGDVPRVLAIELVRAAEQAAREAAVAPAADNAGDGAATDAAEAAREAEVDRAMADGDDAPPAPPVNEAQVEDPPAPHPADTAQQAPAEGGGDLQAFLALVKQAEGQEGLLLQLRSRIPKVLQGSDRKPASEAVTTALKAATAAAATKEAQPA
jgi:phage recombination protein Bet